MMITIHGFPPKTKYQDLKILIKQECNINDFILDNLVSDADGTKKVRIGLTDNTEGYKVMKCLDGYRLPGNFVLKAVPVGKAALNLPSQQSFDSRPSYQNQPRNNYMSEPSNAYNNQGPRGPEASHSHGGTNRNQGSSGRPSSHSGPSGAVGPQGSMDLNRPSPWASGGGNGNQWNTPMMPQVTQNTFGYNSPQANVQPPYGQQQPPHQGHPRTGFNQGRVAEQGYGYTSKNNVPKVVPPNPRYRWVRKTDPDPKASNSPHTDNDCPDSSSADNTCVKTSQEISKDLKNEDPGEPAKLSNKARKREAAKYRNIKKLNPAQRRRLFFWLKSGKTFMEARELCLIRVKQVPEYPAAKAEKKRKVLEGRLRRMSPETQARALKVRRLQGHSAPGAPAPKKPSAPSIRVLIVDELGQMSEEQIEQLQDKILELVDAETDGNGPNFVGCRNRLGCLLLNCANDQTIEWLERHLPDFQLWEGAQLKITKSIPKFVIGVAYVTDPDLDEEAILRMLKSQNQGIDFTKWRINSINPDLPAGQTITFSIDEPSVDTLAERNYFVYLGLKKIKIRLKMKNKQAPPEQFTLPMRQKGKEKWDIAPMRQGGIPKGKVMPPKGPRIPMDQIDMASMGPMGMGNMGPMHAGSMGPMGAGSKGPMSACPMGPMDTSHMGPMGPMDMGPMGPMDMGPMGPLDMGPMGPMDMGPMGSMGIDPIGPMGMAPMGLMGFVPAESTPAAMHGPPRGSSYTPRFQPKHFGGGNEPNNVGGSKNSKKNKKRGGSARNDGPHPNPNNNPYPGKGKSKDRRSQFSGNTKQNQGQKARKKNKGGPSF